MNYNAVIKISGESSKELLELLNEKLEKKGRSEMSMNLFKNELSITILSKDSTSLRAALNSVLSTATILENIKKVK